jgi:hypothetical protein
MADGLLTIRALQDEAWSNLEYAVTFLEVTVSRLRTVLATRTLWQLDEQVQVLRQALVVDRYRQRLLTLWAAEVNLAVEVADAAPGVLSE